jgi:hypothetical protein
MTIELLKVTRMSELLRKADSRLDLDKNKEHLGTLSHGDVMENESRSMRASLWSMS